MVFPTPLLYTPSPNYSAFQQMRGWAKTGECVNVHVCVFVWVCVTKTGGEASSSYTPEDRGRIVLPGPATGVGQVSSKMADMGLVSGRGWKKTMLKWWEVEADEGNGNLKSRSETIFKVHRGGLMGCGRRDGMWVDGSR